MAKPPGGGKPKPKPVPLPKKIVQKAPSVKKKTSTITAGDIAAGKQAIARAKAGGAGTKTTTKTATNPDAINTTTGTTTMQAPNANLLPGAVDPFAGTPYAGMSPYQIAQKIVQDEIDAQTKGINAQRDAQIQANTNALSILSQLGQQLQAGAGQFATNYNQSLQGTGIGGGGAPQGGVPDTGQKSFQGFQSGYAAAQGLINGGMGASNPNQEGGPSAAAPLPQGVSGGDAQNITNTAISTNPFAVLPSAYGRMAQMDANLLAANQAQSLTAYSQAVLDLYRSANKDIFDEFNQIKSEFDAANGAVTSAQADAAAQQAKDAADQQKTYQWQYQQAAARAAELTRSTGLLYQPDPKTLQPVLVKDKQGRPVTTVQGQQAGVRTASAQASIAARQRSLDQADARIKIQIANAQETLRNHHATAAQWAQAHADLQRARKAQQANAAARLKLDRDKAAAAKKGGAGIPAKAKVSIAQVAASASKLAVSLKQGGTHKVYEYGGTTSSDPFWVNPKTNQTSYSPQDPKKGWIKAPLKTLPNYDRARLWQQVYNAFSRDLFAYFARAYPGKANTGFYQARINKIITNAVGWGPKG